MPKNFIYSDVDRFLTVLPSGEFKVHYDEDSVIQSIRNILSTVSGERVRNRIGSSLVRLLFQPVNRETAESIQFLLGRDIPLWEPRVVVVSLDVRANPDNNRFDVYLDLQVRKVSRRVRFTTALRSLA